MGGKEPQPSGFAGFWPSQQEKDSAKEEEDDIDWLAIPVKKEMEKGEEADDKHLKMPK